MFCIAVRDALYRRAAVIAAWVNAERGAPAGLGPARTGTRRL
jgi:hypothetical protein